MSFECKSVELFDWESNEETDSIGQTELSRKLLGFVACSRDRIRNAPMPADGLAGQTGPTLPAAPSQTVNTKSMTG